MDAQQPATVGYLDQADASCGTEVRLHLSSARPASVRVTAIRIGAYGMADGRTVWVSPEVQVSHGSSSRPLVGHTAEPNWPASMTIRPDGTWPPGPYALRIVTDGRADSATYIPLYIRTSGQPAPRLVLAGDLTVAAYNSWGGRSLYAGPGGTPSDRLANRARIASLARPVGGGGFTEWVRDNLTVALALDRESIDADWTSDTSLAADPSQLDPYATIVLPGHSEYWTRGMRDALEGAVAGGTNLVVLGANEIYWQARVKHDAAGRATHVLCYRAAGEDPEPSPLLKTVQWRDPLLDDDRVRLTGLAMGAVGIRADARVDALPSWLFKGTDLKVGSAIPVLYRGESGAVPTKPVDGLQVVLSGRGTAPDGTPQLGATAYYVAPSGALVFNAGTTFWPCSAVNHCLSKTPPATQAAVRTITANVLRVAEHRSAGRSI